MDQRATARGVVRPDRFGGLLLRWLTYNDVGLVGMAVQLGALVALTELGGSTFSWRRPSPSRPQSSHNFVWHERWTWGDRLSYPRGGRWGRLARFNLVTGTVCRS